MLPHLGEELVYYPPARNVVASRSCHHSLEQLARMVINEKPLTFQRSHSCGFLYLLEFDSGHKSLLHRYTPFVKPENFIQHYEHIGMIVYRIWHARNDVQPSTHVGSRPSKRNSTLNSILRIVVDSGLIYMLTSVTVFFSQLANSNAVYITTAAVRPSSM